MKCECIETNVYKVYLYKTYYKYSKETIEGMLLKILQKLKKMYHFDIYAIFDIDCYIDDNFGMILDINREYSPFLLYSKNTDIKMRMYEVKFLYETDDYFLKDRVNSKIYIYKNRFYLDLDDEYIKICEYVDDIIYKDNKLINNN